MARAPDLTLYLVTDPELCAERGVVATAVAAVRGGATCVQLRNKSAPEAALRREAAALLAALRPLGAPLLVNDRIEVAAAVGADGAHLGQEDGDPAAARRLLGDAAVLGLSVQTEDHARAVDPGAVDYVGTGAVFATATKPGRTAPIGVEGAARLKRLSRLPAVAIGGIDAGSAGGLVAAGLDGVAVVSAICGASDPEVAARTIRAAIDQARIARAALPPTLRDETP
ncbi:MAG: thiamine phosphate synthase [Pseudomonadota bacterium]